MLSGINSHMDETRFVPPTPSLPRVSGAERAGPHSLIIKIHGMNTIPYAPYARKPPVSGGQNVVDVRGCDCETLSSDRRLVYDKGPFKRSLNLHLRVPPRKGFVHTSTRMTVLMIKMLLTWVKSRPDVAAMLYRHHCP